MRSIILLSFLILSNSLAVYSSSYSKDSLKKVIALAEHDTTVAENYNLLGESVYLSAPQEAKEYWERSLQIASANLEKKLSEKERLVFSKLKAVALNNIAYLLKNDGDTKAALDYIEQCIKIELDIKDITGLIEPFNLKASILESQGKINDALTIYLKSLNIAVAYKFIDQQVIVLNNIGYLHSQQGNHDKALQYYKNALKLVKGQGNKHYMAVLLNNIGKIYNRKGQPDKALSSYKEAAELLEEIKNPAPLSVALNNIAKILHKKGDAEGALTYFRKALKIAEELKNKESISSILNNIAALYTEQRNFQAAEALYERSLNISRSSEWLLGQRNSVEGLQKLYALKGDHQKAYAHLLDLMKLKDSALNLENSKAVAEMETKYQTEKKQLEIENLEKEKSLKNVELQKKSEEIKRQNVQNIAFAGGLGLTALLSLFIYRGYRHKKTANEIISQQKAIVEEKNKDITDSINYAKRIQDAILPPHYLVKEHLPDSFVLFKPKDIVAGDFYWMETIKEAGRTKSTVLFAAADCTGHGVPGAMVSVVCSNALNRAVKEFGITDPGKILDKARELVIETFEKSENDVKDGMDISLCVLDPEKSEIRWAGANNPLWILTGGELKEIKGDKQPVGKHTEPKSFSTHKLDFQKGDTIYLFTDGYADQFGGESGKKFKYSKLKELVLSVGKEAMPRQKEIIADTFEIWRGHHEQVDDVCFIGVRL